MKLLIIGPQGSGKGTQAKLIAEKLGIPTISTGDMFREAVKEGTELGKKAKEIMDKGDLIPDEITNEIVKERIAKDDCTKGFLLDGYPRNLQQAEFLDGITSIDKVIDLELSDEEAIKRISGRRTCTKCGEIYNVYFKPTQKEDVCDACGGELKQRDDDTEEGVKVRLGLYHEQTEPILEHYKDRVVKVDGSKEIQEVKEEIFSKLD